jgi:hypothetical protein
MPRSVRTCTPAPAIECLSAEFITRIQDYHGPIGLYPFSNLAPVVDDLDWQRGTGQGHGQSQSHLIYGHFSKHGEPREATKEDQLRVYSKSRMHERALAHASRYGMHQGESKVTSGPSAILAAVNAWTGGSDK